MHRRTDDSRVLPATAKHLRSLPAREEYASGWRKSVLLEYYYNDWNAKCMTGSPCLPAEVRVSAPPPPPPPAPRSLTSLRQGGGYPERDTWCGDLDDNTHCWALYHCNTSCYNTETPMNNYIGLRTVTGANTLYVEYQTGDLDRAAIEFDNITSVEMYNYAVDPWALKNIVDAATVSEKISLKKELHKWYNCKGVECP